MSRDRIFQAILFVSLALNLTLGIFITHKYTKKDFYSQADEKSAHYPLLSKRIFIENQNDIIINFIPLREAMRKYVGAIPEPLGIYFEYLPSGTSIGVNDRNEFAIASLIKIPLAMAVYKQIDNSKLKKDTVLTMEDEDMDIGFGTLWQEGAGSTFTVEHLLHKLLIDSDNTASKMLRKIVKESEIKKVFDSLDINIESKDGTIRISPKSYSSVLRSLYLSSYLSRDSSHEILSILTQTNFSDKIVAGIPKDVDVAHKIGIWDLDKDEGIVYSDCGIVYVPKRPYMLCIMTKTSDQKAKKYMSHISNMIFSYITRIKS